MNVGEKPFNTLVNLNVNNPLEKTSLNLQKNLMAKSKYFLEPQECPRAQKDKKIWR